MGAGAAGGADYLWHPPGGAGSGALHCRWFEKQGRRRRGRWSSCAAPPFLKGAVGGAGGGGGKILGSGWRPTGWQWAPKLATVEDLSRTHQGGAHSWPCRRSGSSRGGSRAVLLGWGTAGRELCVRRLSLMSRERSGTWQSYPNLKIWPRSLHAMQSMPPPGHT